jgi:hypothetical protein
LGKAYDPKGVVRWCGNDNDVHNYLISDLVTDIGKFYRKRCYADPK